MAGVNITFDVAATNRVLENSAELKALLRRLGERGVQHGASIAPVQSGDYRDGFVYTIGHDQHGRPALCVANTDFKTWWIEKGTAGAPARHVLDQVLDDLRS